MEQIYEVVRIKQERKVLPKKYQKLLNYRMGNPRDVANFIIDLIGDEDREVFLVIGLNVKMQVIAVHRAHVGDLNSSIVNPREVFKMAILNNCGGIIVAHVHPSGDVTPSMQDIKVSERLEEAGDILAIELFDHIIVSGSDYISLKEQGYF